MGGHASRPLPPRPAYFTALFRGLMLRCPRCGQGEISAGLFKRLDACSACGQSLKLKEGEFTGGAYLGYGVSVAILVAIFAALVWGFNWDIEQTLWVLLPGAVIIPILLHRHMVGAFTAILISSGAMDERDPER